MGLPSVTRKTDKGLPTYDDADESDVFILSGAEDLVPIPGEDGEPERRPRTVGGKHYQVTRYRPRAKGLFARIERWTEVFGGDTHWRSISRDNVTTVYGRDCESRIDDPADPADRVFSWLICESYDAVSNAIVYRYATEDDREVDLGAAHERDRPDGSRAANRCLKSVRYGNKVSRLADPPPERDAEDGWHFELVFDVRSYRLCQRILMFHQSRAVKLTSRPELNGLLRGVLRDDPALPGKRAWDTLPKPMDTFPLYFDDNTMQDLFVLLTWTAKK